MGVITSSPAGSSKECVLCGEPIRPAARKCPHCQGWQSRWAALADQKNPKFQLLFLLIFIGVFIVPLLMIFRDSHTYLAEDRPPLQVTASRLHIVDRSGTPWISVVGTLRNTSTDRWSRPSFHVDIFNGRDELVDVLDGEVGDLVILPKSDSSFRVLQRAATNSSEYVRHQVAVRTAHRGQ